MRSVVLVVLLGATAAAAPRVPASLDIDLSKLVLVQARKPAPTPALVLCDRNDKDGCMQACDGGSAASCFRLGWMLARGGADNPVVPEPKFELDLVGAEIALAKACTLGFHAGCVDVEAIRARLKKPPNTAQLRTSCAAGYGRACSALVAGIKDPKARRALLEQGCNSGDGTSCMAIADTMPDTGEQVRWMRKAFNAPGGGIAKLDCPAGMQARRSVFEFDGGEWSVYSPRWQCGTFDAKTGAFVEEGPYLEHASEEDELVHPYGVISERGRMLAGEKHGLFEKWDQRGRLESTIHFKAGLEHGQKIWLDYESDGTISIAARVVNVEGKKQGTFRRAYYRGGKPYAYEFGEYKNDVKVGAWLNIDAKPRRVTSVQRYVAGVAVK
ncbi:MAG: hypothetical protein JWP01_2570 [Myxococcales bacterium]|nr:hypothetical protein [Myxococcales bacterium]